MRDLARIVQAKTIRSAKIKFMCALRQHPTGSISYERSWFSTMPHGIIVAMLYKRLSSKSSGTSILRGPSGKGVVDHIS